MVSFRPVLFGAGAGALVALGVWALASKRLDARFTAGAKQLDQELGHGRSTLEARLAAGRRELDHRIRVQVENEVPPRVQTAMAQTLARYGVTPDTGRRVALALAAAERAGLLGVGRA